MMQIEEIIYWELNYAINLFIEEKKSSFMNMIDKL